MTQNNYITVLEYYFNNYLLVGKIPDLELKELEEYWKESEKHLEYDHP